MLGETKTWPYSNRRAAQLSKQGSVYLIQYVLDLRSVAQVDNLHALLLDTLYTCTFQVDDFNHAPLHTAKPPLLLLPY